MVVGNMGLRKGGCGDGEGVFMIYDDRRHGEVFM